MYLLAIHMPSLGKCLFRFSVHFKIGFFFLLLSCMSSLYFWLSTPCHMYDLQIFSTTSYLFTLSIVLPFLECHMVEIIHYVAFPDWLLFTKYMHLRFLHVSSWLDSSFLFSVEQYSIVWMEGPFIHLLKDILVASEFWQ